MNEASSIPSVENPGCLKEAMQLRAILESAPEAIITMDVAGKIIEFNPAAEAIFGYRRSEVVGRAMPELLIPPAQRQRHWHGLAAYLAAPPGSESVRRREITALRADGREFPAELTVTRINLPGVLLLTAFVRDISQRNRAEKQNAAFCSLGHRLSAAAAPEQAASIIFETADHFFGWDAGYLDLCTPDQARLIPILAFDSFQGRRRAISHEPSAFEVSPMTRLVLKDGAQLIEREPGAAPPLDLVPFGDARRHSASMMYVPVRAEGAAIGVLSIQSYAPKAYSREDLSLLQALADDCGGALARISLTEALRQSEAALRDLAAIIENSEDAIYARTLDGIILSWNPAAVRLYGYQAQEIIGQSVSLLVPPSHSDELAAIMQDICHGKKAEDFETQRLRKDGKLIAVSLTVSPIRDAGGQVTGASSIARDITRRKQLEREVIDISANERRRIGHELHDGLGQYMAGIAFCAKALEQALAAAASPQTAAARELVALLGHAIGQARSLARGFSPLDVERSGLVAAFQNLAAETAHLFSVHCQVHCADSDLLIRPQISLELYRIAQEAIHNAINHGHARRIDIELAVDATYLRLSIRDDGIGFQVERIAPTGIGLRVMGYRARSIGGTLNLNSKPNQGAEICCLVPRPICLPPATSGEVQDSGGAGPDKSA